MFVHWHGERMHRGCSATQTPVSLYICIKSREAGGKRDVETTN
jgi:hypothetical protein